MIALVFCTYCALVGCKKPDAPPIAESNATAKKLEASTTLVSSIPVPAGDKHFIGSEACQSCHTDQHQSWHASFHRTMTQPINPTTAPQAIIDNEVVVAGKKYRFERKDSDFLVTHLNPSTGANSEYRLVMMTGSHHMHVFWVDSGIEKTPDMLPIIFLLDQQKWIPRESAFLRTPNPSYQSERGGWNRVCCQCHSTHPKPNVKTYGADAASPSWNTEIVEFGISCEACHGPGKEHVAIHQSSKQASPKLSDRVVDPMKLETSIRSDMCARCHSVGYVNNSAAYKEKGLDFRPGQSIDESKYYQLLRASPEHISDPHLATWLNRTRSDINNTFWPDGQLRGTGRAYSGMIESSCAKHGDMTCFSCHTMHQNDLALQDEWKDDQLKPGMRGDAACIDCHKEYVEMGAKHTHHPVESSGSRCVNCHMPHTVYGLLKTVRSHTISSPSVATAIKTTRATACNLCHLDQTLEETSQHLAKWYGHDQPRLTKLEKETAVSVLQLLKGDAPQRALQVAAMERKMAQETSGTDWMVPFLMVGMLDRHDAIRLISERAYRSLKDAPEIQFDPINPGASQTRYMSDQLQKVCSEAVLKHDPALLIGEDGKFDIEQISNLLQNRNERPVDIQE